ncbi:hypothetical protein JW848_02450 [Candidatus Bipolaricaulota bacterium]|nr:hypothetical protein [Candidatus Bipolaricaulota bacterium]
MNRGSQRGEHEQATQETYTLPRNWKGVLSCFGQALSEEGSSGLASTYEMLTRGPMRFRAALRAIECVFPLQRVVSMGAEFDARIARDGLCEASRWLLTDSGIPWKAEFPEVGRELLESGPLVIYGNHPSLATPFILAAVLEHPRLGYISSAYVSKLLPAMVPHLFAVELIRHQQVRNRPGSGAAHLVAHSLLADIYERPSREIARAANRQVITNAAKHVTQGGALVIYPAGGGKDRLWYPGIGRLCSELLQQAEHTLYLVPVRVDNNSHSRVYCALSNKRYARRRTRRLNRQPVLLKLARPLPFEGLEQLKDASSQEIAAVLQHHYNKLFEVRGKRQTERAIDEALQRLRKDHHLRLPLFESGRR